LCLFPFSTASVGRLAESPQLPKFGGHVPAPVSLPPVLTEDDEALRPIACRLVLRTVVEAVAGPASEGAAEQHSAGPPTCGTGKPAPTAPKAGPRVGEAHGLSYLLPRLTNQAVGVFEVDTIGPTHDAARAARPVD